MKRNQHTLLDMLPHPLYKSSCTSALFISILIGKGFHLDEGSTEVIVFQNGLSSKGLSHHFLYCPSSTGNLQCHESQTVDIQLIVGSASYG